MRFTSFLVFMDEGPGATSRVALDSAISGPSKAHVIGLAASLAYTPAVDPFADGGMLGKMPGLCRDLAEAGIGRVETPVCLVLNH